VDLGSAGGSGGGVLPSLHGHDERRISAELAAPSLPESSGDGAAPAFPRRPSLGGGGGGRGGFFLFILKIFAESHLNTRQIVCRVPEKRHTAKELFTDVCMP
jgi:hypothetical protein